MQKNKTISILGCGWLGLPLGEKLAQLGYSVKGSTTTPAKTDVIREKNISPYVVNLTDENTWSVIPEFLTTDILIISFPPGLRAGNGTLYIQQINTLARFINQAPVKSILFISSTSVYPDLNKTVTEAEDLSAYLPENPLLQAEQTINSFPDKETTIVRFSGLVGGSRQPGRFFANKTAVPNPNGPVNLIHLEDCVALLLKIIEQENWGELYNACADEHPSRQKFYTAAARAIGLTPPHFAAPAPTDSFKIISNEKLKKALHYQFIFPDPLLFI